MRINRVSIKGFRAFRDMTPIDLGPFTTIVGRNDTGKSSILHALDIFFNNPPHPPDEGDFNRDQTVDDPIAIQVSFSDLPPSVQLEEGVDTDFNKENLLDNQHNLTIKKTYSRKNPKKPEITLIVEDFEDSEYQNLCSLKEGELNEKGKGLRLDFKKAGSGITNKEKRIQIRQVARDRNIPLKTVEIVLLEGVWKRIEGYLPDFTLFRADEPLSEEETTFQNQFKKVIETAVDKISEKDNIEKGIEEAINKEVQKIHSFLLKHTDEVASIKANPSFEWKKLASFSLECSDKQGKDIAFSKRGSGLRRLLMVAYFQYLAQKSKLPGSMKNHIYGIEEPETYLHPSAQRILLDSFKSIATLEQILVSSHSPVFAGSTDINNLIMITRENGIANVKQGTNLDPENVANELGVEPPDQIYGYSALILVDGRQDCDIFHTVANTLHAGKKLTSTFEHKQIGILPAGGDSLKHWITLKRIKKVNKNYAVILDSDRKSASDPIPQQKLKLESEVKRDGGKCFILRKREIENYLHSDVIRDRTSKNVEVDDFIDLKMLFDNAIGGLFKYMTIEQILERDMYYEDGSEKHELLEICEQILNLVP